MHAPPTKVVIVGSLPELGNWDVKKGEGKIEEDGREGEDLGVCVCLGE
jgi:hypothetical protein